jgi:hypothetical protein
MTEQEKQLMVQLNEIGLQVAKLKAENDCLSKENLRLWMLVDKFMDREDKGC